MLPLNGFRVVSLAINAPGPVCAARLRGYGASVLKVEPPEGDPLQHLGTGWYEELTEGMELVTLNLKDPAGRARLDAYLAEADLLLTAQRPAALERLGLGWDALHARFPRLCHVAIVGFPPPDENVPGHDLNYQAKYHMLTPPHMPRVLVADMAGAERAATEALALLLARERGAEAARSLVALSDAAKAFAVTVRMDITTPGGLLGGGLPNYAIYPTSDGYLACGALEMHFFQRLLAGLGEEATTHEALGAIFMRKTAAEWEAWGNERDIPLVAIS
jgi:alpha-methylacyl-CoA racemase